MKKSYSVIIYVWKQKKELDIIYNVKKMTCFLSVLRIEKHETKRGEEVIRIFNTTVLPFALPLLNRFVLTFNFRKYHFFLGYNCSFFSTIFCYFQWFKFSLRCFAWHGRGSTYEQGRSCVYWVFTRSCREPEKISCP